MFTLSGGGGPEPREARKRKRDANDAVIGPPPLPPGHSCDRIPQPPPPQSGNGTPINYLAKSNDATRLKLIPGDTETFSDVLSLIADYEGVLNRHESLAASLGAKLTAPRLLRAMEGLFEGSITVLPPSPSTAAAAAAASSSSSASVSVPGAPPTSWYAPTWLEIVTFARSHPGEFGPVLTADDGRRVCRFAVPECGGVQVEICEDDWRLIASGALDRYFRLSPAQFMPLEEDETAELVTLDILDHRLQILIRRADEVALKARQLNYHMSGRRANIASRRNAAAASNQIPSPSSPAFPSLRKLPPLAPAPLRTGVSNYDVHADLLQQFLAPAPTPAPASTASGSLSRPELTPVSRPPSTASPILNAPPTKATATMPPMDLHLFRPRLPGTVSCPSPTTPVLLPAHQSTSMTASSSSTGPPPFRRLSPAPSPSLQPQSSSGYDPRHQHQNYQHHHTQHAQYQHPQHQHQHQHQHFFSTAPPTPEEDPSAAYRPLVQTHVEKLARGSLIIPPCDRCRRLGGACIKNLTSCQACTRKHAKCAWKTVTEAEAARLRTEMAAVAVAMDHSVSGVAGRNEFADPGGREILRRAYDSGGGSGSGSGSGSEGNNARDRQRLEGLVEAGTTTTDSRDRSVRTTSPTQDMQKNGGVGRRSEKEKRVSVDADAYRTGREEDEAGTRTRSIMMTEAQRAGEQQPGAGGTDADVSRNTRPEREKEKEGGGQTEARRPDPDPGGGGSTPLSAAASEQHVTFLSRVAARAADAADARRAAPAPAPAPAPVSRESSLGSRSSAARG